MSDIGKRIEDEVMSRLEGLIEEEELSAMIDAALPKVRKKLEERVEDEVQSLATRKLEPFFGAYYDGERFAEVGKQLTEALVARVIKCYEEDAWALKNQRQPPHGLRSRHGSKISRLASLIEDRFMNRLALAVDDKIDAVLGEPKIDEKADAVLANILPRAAAAFMESGAFRMIRSFNEAMRVGREITVHSESKPVCVDCPNCHTAIRACETCGKTGRAGDLCCNGNLAH